MRFEEFAKIIKEKREKMLYTQAEFALMVPIKKSTYNRIENGKQEPTFIQLQNICKILKLDLTALLELDKNENNLIYFD